uniref:Uncharacterized protein n=1 Tax=Colobus angolensis palliatus TaxID=336983 RepID=A0A2K5JRZ4_COLAP
MCHPFPVLHCHPHSCPLPSVCSLNTRPHPPSSIPAQASPSPIPPFALCSFALCPSTLEMLLVAQSKSLPEEQQLAPPPRALLLYSQPQRVGGHGRSTREAAQTWEERSIGAHDNMGGDYRVQES